MEVDEMEKSLTLKNMKKQYQFWVYIMASDSGTLYVGFTNNLEKRVQEHKSGYYDKSFSKKYHCHKLVYHEEFQYVFDAIARENQIKRWRREKKQFLIGTINSSWKDLSEGWYD